MPSFMNFLCLGQGQPFISLGIWEMKDVKQSCPPEGDKGWQIVSHRLKTVHGSINCLVVSNAKQYYSLIKSNLISSQRNLWKHIC